MTNNKGGISELPGHVQIAEPCLKFHPQRSEDVHDHPLKGLQKFGPYSRALLGNVVDPIRIGVIGPPESRGVVEGILEELERWAAPTDRRAYLIDFSGFSSTFGVRCVVSDDATISLDEKIDAEIDSSQTPHLVLAEHLARAINAANSARTQFDLLIFYLPERWSDCFHGGPEEEFDLHDFVKSHAASLGIPTQLLREDRVCSFTYRCSVMWRLAIAIYTKAGGIPWKLAYMEPDTLFVGLGYAVKYSKSGNPEFLTTCSQVFDFDGTGLEFVAYETRDLKVDRESNPFLSRSDMHRVMARCLDLYNHRHGGRPPTKVVVHKLNEFKAEEIDGCFDAFKAVPSIELVQIIRDSFWRGAHLDPPKKSNQKSTPGYACRRGSCMLLGGDEALLWTQGNVPQNGRNFFKEMKGTPKPLLVKRFAGSSPLSMTCRSILSLTKMDWNNDALYDQLPVTLSFAKRLAQTLKRMPNLTAKPYAFRLFI